MRTLIKDGTVVTASDTFPADVWIENGKVAALVAPGTQVWLTAFFFNERKQNGPACAGVGAIINYGGSMPMAA